MKQLRSYTHTGVIAILFVLAGLVGVFQSVIAANPNTIYLQASSSSVTSGSNVTVAVRIAPGAGGVDSVEATVNYDTSKLQYQSIDTNGSAFSQPLLQTTGSGSIHVARGLNIGESNVTQDSLIVNITFKATATSGSTSPSISGAQATNGGPYTNPSAAGTTINIVSPPTNPPPPTPPATPPATPPTTPPSTSPTTPPSTKPSPGTPTTPKPGTNPTTPTPTTPTPSPTAPTGNEPVVSEQKVEFTNAAMTVTTKTPSRVYIQYGLTADGLNNSTELTPLGTTHDVKLDPKLLIPGETYYYVIVAKDEKGTLTETQPVTLTTKGLSVSVRVFDKDNKPFKNVKVTLHSDPMTATTDENGVATFENVIPGSHKLIYSQGSKTFEKELNVENNVETAGDEQKAETQNISVVLAASQSAGVGSALLVPLLVLVVLGAGAGVFLFTRQKVRLATSGVPVTSTPVVIGNAANDSNAATSALEALPETEKPTPGSTIGPKGPNDGAGGNQ